MKWLRAILALWLWAAMAPFLLIGWLAGIAWVGLAAGFKLGGLVVEAAVDDGRYAWTVRTHAELDRAMAEYKAREVPDA